jgi:hypothetical protein
MTELSWSYLATGVGTFFAVGMICTVLKAVLGMYWSPLLNRIATFVLAVAIPPLALWAMATNDSITPAWQALVLAGLNGCIIAGSLLGVNELYRAKIAREQVMERLQQYGKFDEDLLYGDRG